MFAPTVLHHPERPDHFWVDRSVSREELVSLLEFHSPRWHQQHPPTLVCDGCTRSPYCNTIWGDDYEYCPWPCFAVRLVWNCDPTLFPSADELRLAAGPEPKQPVTPPWQPPESRRSRAEVDEDRDFRRLRHFVIAAATRMGQGYECAICHEEVAPDDVSIDHTIARHNGGPTTRENLQLVHKRCNSRKGARVQ